MIPLVLILITCTLITRVFWLSCTIDSGVLPKSHHHCCHWKRSWRRQLDPWLWSAASRERSEEGETQGTTGRATVTRNGLRRIKLRQRISAGFFILSLLLLGYLSYNYIRVKQLPISSCVCVCVEGGGDTAFFFVTTTKTGDIQYGGTRTILIDGKLFIFLVGLLFFPHQKPGTADP